MLKERDKQLQLYSTFAIKKRNIQWLLKQSLNLFKLIQHRFNFDSACFNTVERGGGGGGGAVSTSLFNMLKQTLQTLASVFIIYFGTITQVIKENYLR